MAPKERRDAENEVRSWGFDHVCPPFLMPLYSSTSEFFQFLIRKGVPAHSQLVQVFTWSDGPNAYYRPHSHSGLTTHLILDGQLTILYPDDKEPKKETFGPGDRVDVDARRKHEVWMGGEGCTYVIGE